MLRHLDPGHPMPTGGRHRHSISVLCLALMLLAAAPPSALAQFSVPTGFADQPVIAGLSAPVGIGFIPDGRFLVVEQYSARVRLVVNGALAAVDPVVTVPNVETTGGERGLLGIAVDPGWPARPYIYVQYDYAQQSFVRISRFTVGGDLGFTGNGALTIDPATRYDIITDAPDNSLYHNGGTLRFGADGMLYSSLGDDVVSCSAQDLTALSGKILRLNVSGLPAGGGGPPAKSAITPVDNPYVANANANAKLVAFLGLRNPFRFGIDRSNGAVVIGDVGESSVEEVDYLTTLGRNLEWPHDEGNVSGPMTCPGADVSRFTNPAYTYTHSQGAAVVASIVYRAPPGATASFPASYAGDIFFTDYYSSWLRRLNNNGGTWSPEAAPGQPNPTDWGNGSSAISDWGIGPDGCIYYCGLDAGTVRRIRYTSTAGVPPPSASSVEFRAPYPSPSRGPVTLDYTLPSEAEVALAIFDASGRRIRGLVAERVAAGAHRLTWDGQDANGHPVSAGIYLARLVVDGQPSQRRFVVAR